MFASTFLGRMENDGVIQNYQVLFLLGKGSPGVSFPSVARTLETSAQLLSPMPRGKESELKGWASVVVFRL